MKNILAENLLRFGVKNLKESDKEKISESLLTEDIANNPDFAKASKTFFAMHKGNWNNVKGKTLTYAGSKYFICKVLPANPDGGTLMNEQSFNLLTIRPNRYGVPMPFWAGTIWLKDNGTAITTNTEASPDPAPSTFYPDVKTGWAGLTGDEIAGIKQYGAFGTNWTTYCTNVAPTVSAMKQVINHVQANLEKYKTQPTGFASDLWLTIKPLVGA